MLQTSYDAGDNSVDDGSDYLSASSLSDSSFQSLPQSLDSLLEVSFESFSKNFNIVHINAQSIPAHYSDLLTTFSSNRNIHAILVSETFLKPCLPSTSYCLPGFHLIRNDRTGKGGGGVAIYLRGHLSFNLINKSPSAYCESSEHLFIEVLMGHLKILLGVFYSPNLHIDYFAKFESLLESLVPTADHTIILGDFNTCLLKQDFRSNHLRSIVDSTNLNILPLTATHRFPGCRPSLLDLAIVSSVDHVSSHGQLPAEAFSYHDLLFLSYKIRCPKPKPRVIMQRNFNSVDTNRFMSDLSNIDWDAVLDAPTIDLKMEIFNSNLIQIFDIHAPLRPVRLKHLPAPWLSNDIKVIMARRNVAKARFGKDPSDENRLKYRRLRNRCSRLCRDAQRRHIHSSVANGDPAKVWSFLNSLGIGKSKTSVPNNLDLASLNQYFSAPSAIPHYLKQSTLQSLCPSPNSQRPTFSFRQVFEREVGDNIQAVNSNAEGMDGIGRRMILLGFEILVPILCHIFNFSLNTGSFPSCWRQAVVIPIPKTSNPSLPSHFRPISILPFLSKILERLVLHQVNAFINSNNFLSPFQSGFRPGHSTTTALTKVSDDIRLGMSNQQLTVLVLLDFSNAFNTVDYDILLAMLRSLLVSDTVIEWFRSYLFGRRQCVRANDKMSCASDVTAGVPQGGVLSPFLFSIFINFLTPLLSCQFHLYADDLQIYSQASVDDITNMIASLNADLATIYEWSRTHGLTVNPNKSQAIIIGGSKQIAKLNKLSIPPLMLNGVTLTYSNVAKNLGVLFDCTLSWAPHVSEISRKVFAASGSLRRWKNLLPVKTKVELAQSLLLPILDYADVCLIDLSEDLLNKLQRLQNLCIRFIYGLRKFDHVSEYRLKLEWLPIRLRREEHILILVYNVLYDPRTPSYLKECFRFLGVDHNRDLRSKADNVLTPPFTRSGYFKDSFTVKATFLWNQLPPEIRHSKSLSTFKSKLHKHLLLKSSASNML